MDYEELFDTIFHKRDIEDVFRSIQFLESKRKEDLESLLLPFCKEKGSISMEDFKSAILKFKLNVKEEALLKCFTHFKRVEKLSSADSTKEKIEETDEPKDIEVAEGTEDTTINLSRFIAMYRIWQSKRDPQPSIDQTLTIVRQCFTKIQNGDGNESVSKARDNLNNLYKLCLQKGNF